MSRIDCYLATWEGDPDGRSSDPFVVAMRRVEYRAAFVVPDPAMVVGLVLVNHDTGDTILDLDLRPPTGGDDE